MYCLYINTRVKQCTSGRLAITTCSPRFLIVVFQICRHIIVDHEPHVGLVDAHTEGIGRHHDLHPVVEEIVLILPPGIRIQLGMVSRSPDAPALQ